MTEPTETPVNRIRAVRDAITAETAGLPESDHNGRIPTTTPDPTPSAEEPPELPRNPKPDHSQGGRGGVGVGDTAARAQAEGRWLDAIRQITAEMRQQTSVYEHL